MYREPLEELRHLNVVFSDGGLGDSIARLPVIKYINDYHPHIKVHLWVPDFFIDIAKRSLNDQVVVRGFSEQAKYKEHFITRTFISTQYNNLAVHLVDHAFHVIVGKDVEIEHKNYLKINLDKVSVDRFDLPKKYVVVSTGFTAEVREWLPSIINEVVSYIKEKGYEVVFLGKTESDNGNKYIIQGGFSEDINFDAGINLIDKTNMLETVKIIDNSKFLIGMDNGLGHIAGTTEVPLIMSYPTVESKYRLPYRHNQLGWNCYPIHPPESLKCRFCQSNMCFAFEQDFRKCFYIERKEDTEIQCIKQITADMYIKEIDKIL